MQAEVVDEGAAIEVEKLDPDPSPAVIDQKNEVSDTSTAPASSSSPHWPSAISLPPDVFKGNISWRNKARRFWRRSWAVTRALADVFRDAPTPRRGAQEYGLDVLNSLCQLVSLPPALMPLESKARLMERFGKVYPHVRSSAFRDWLEGRLTGGAPPFPRLRMSEARIEMLCRAMDWLETVRWIQFCEAAESERERLMAEQETRKQQAMDRARDRGKRKIRRRLNRIRKQGEAGEPVEAAPVRLDPCGEVMKASRQEDATW